MCLQRVFECVCVWQRPSQLLFEKPSYYFHCLNKSATCEKRGRSSNDNHLSRTASEAAMTVEKFQTGCGWGGGVLIKWG